MVLNEKLLLLKLTQYFRVVFNIKYTQNERYFKTLFTLVKVLFY